MLFLKLQRQPCFFRKTTLPSSGMSSQGSWLRSKAGIPGVPAFGRSFANVLFFGGKFFLGGRAIHYTYMYMQRKKPQASNGRPSTAEAANYPHYLGRGRHKSLQRGNMSGKTSSLQGSCSPAYSQACSFSTNKASPLSESTQHSCQDHKYIEVPGRASSRQDSCSPSICQAGFFSLDKRQAHA